MKNKTIFLYLLTLALYIKVNAQSGIDSVLEQIAVNNKTIQAHSQYYEAQKLQFKTGNNPANPVIEYDYLTGSPANTGNQHDFLIVQQFDFPSVYAKKAQLAKTQITQTEYQLTANRQDILLEAKKYCIGLVYQRKMNGQLAQQKQQAEKMAVDFQTRLDKGEGNILDVNKARLQLIEINREYQENLSAINQLNQKLKEMNGGIEISFTDTVYPLLSGIPYFGQLEKEYEDADPLLKNLEQQKLIAKKQLELSRAMSLPKMELGYHYQGFAGQKFNGIHTGISVPLWETNNTVKQKKARLLFNDMELQAHVNEHYYHIMHIYEKYINLQAILTGYQNTLSAINSTELLNKALAAGHLTSIEYFMEAGFYHQAIKNYLQTEKEYYETIAELYKFKL